MGVVVFTYLVIVFILSTLIRGEGADIEKWTKLPKIRAPEFGKTESKIEVLVGQNAYLPCIVHNLGDRAVTWLRGRDLHILTTGLHTYSADDRFQVIAEPKGNSWRLLVKSAQPRDTGVYECQVNTDPKMSRPLFLGVLSEAGKDTKTVESSVPLRVQKSKVFVANRTAVTTDGHLRVEIHGSSEVNIEERSKLSLNCIVTSTLGASAVVYWFHDSNLLDYSLVKLKINQERGVTSALLVVEGVGKENEGIYSCVAPGSHPASIRVHVHSSKQGAAIQHNSNDTGTISKSSPINHYSPYLFIFITIKNLI